MPKRLILFVEGQSDVTGAQALVRRLLNEIAPWDCVYLDPNPFRVGGIQNLTSTPKQQQNWLRHLQAAGKRGNVGGILLLLDGDADRVERVDFCAADIARLLCTRARAIGAGTTFSLACVFAMRELESWLIGGFESLPGRSANPPPEPLNIELRRGAKEWLNRAMLNGYKPTVHQAELASKIDLNAVRQRNLRSFRRMENALAQIIGAIRADAHVATP